MTFNGILYHVADEVATITFNRPEVSNGFNIPMCEEILEAIELAAKDESVKFLVINANGKVFSVGGDLAEMQRAVSDDDVQSLVKIAELVNDISRTISEQSLASNEIAHQVERIAGMSESNSRVIGETASTTDELSSLAGKLSQSVDRFRL